MKSGPRLLKPVRQKASGDGVANATPERGASSAGNVIICPFADARPLKSPARKAHYKRALGVRPGSWCVIFPESNRYISAD